MEETVEDLIEKVLSEYPKDKVVAALNILAGLSKEELQGVAELALIIEETTNQ